MPRFHYFKGKKEASKFLQRIYREIKDDSDAFWKIVFNKNLPGDSCGILENGENLTVFHLDPNEPVVRVFSHECLHYFYEERSELAILLMEDELMYWLSNRQLENLFIKMSELIWRKRC